MTKALVEITAAGVFGPDGKEIDVGATINVPLTNGGTLPVWLTNKGRVVKAAAGAKPVTNPKK